MIISDLPLDLESEILSRVPATSLSQFRSTCKRWYALFKDPRFVKKNMDKAETQVIFNKDFRVYSGNISLRTTYSSFDPSFQFTGMLKSLKDSKHVEISIIFQCDGLLLCTTKDDRLVVWNPCTGQTKWIKSNKSKSNKSNQKQTLYKYFLGYENKNGSCCSYKILSLSTEIEMYEFNSDSWRVLKDLDRRTWCCLLDSVSLKGNTYWFDKDHPVSSIIMFNFTGENFGRLSLPFKSHNYIRQTVVLSAVREEKLAVLRFDEVSYEMKIWVTTNSRINEAKDLSWSDFLVVDTIHDGMFSMVSFLVDEENKVVVCCDSYYLRELHTRVYIVGEDMHKQVYEEATTKTPYVPPRLLSYVPSLVHI